MALLLFLVFLFVGAFDAEVYSLTDQSDYETRNMKEENRKLSKRGLRIVGEDEFSKYRQEPLTIPPPLSHPSNNGNVNVIMRRGELEGSKMDQEPQLYRYQHHKQGRGHGHRHGYQHHHGIGVGPQHFDAELNNDVSSFHYSDHTSSEVDYMPMKPRKFRPHFQMDESYAQAGRVKIHPHHKHHPIKASFDEFDGHTGEYVGSGHVTTVSSNTNGLLK